MIPPVIIVLAALCTFENPRLAVAPSRLGVIQQAPAFTLTTQSGAELRSQALRGTVVLVGFIFTTCNGTCPATTHRMAQVQQELKARGLGSAAKTRLLSITLDPVRDTPERLDAYSRLYDADLSNWSFLTGPPERVHQVLSAWGMWARPAANGQLDHPSRIFLVDRAGRVREIYNLSYMKVQQVVDDMQLLLSERAP
jgi:protein SCO1/2